MPSIFESFAPDKVEKYFSTPFTSDSFSVSKQGTRISGVTNEEGKRVIHSSR
jgi:hypothetical protein